MRFVELKSAEQLDMQLLHCVRDRLVGGRMALLNHLRAVLLERGIAAPRGRRKLEQMLEVLLEEAGGEDERTAALGTVRRGTARRHAMVPPNGTPHNKWLTMSSISAMTPIS